MRSGVLWSRYHLFEVESWFLEFVGERFVGKMEEFREWVFGSSTSRGWGCFVLCYEVWHFVWEETVRHISLSNWGCSILILHFYFFESVRCAVQGCRCSCSLEPNFNQSLFPKVPTVKCQKDAPRKKFFY